MLKFWITSVVPLEGYFSLSYLYSLGEPGTLKNCSYVFQVFGVLWWKTLKLPRESEIIFIKTQLKILSVRYFFKNFNKLYCLQIHLKRNIHRNPLEQRNYLRSKFNTCQLSFIRGSKITQLLFCPAASTCFGSFGLLFSEGEEYH